MNEEVKIQGSKCKIGGFLNFGFIILNESVYSPLLIHNLF